MSLQNLLEMDSLSKPTWLNDRDSDRPMPKPKPKPRPRAVESKMSRSPSFRKKERDVDDVMSFSSASGGSTEKKNFLRSASPSPKERRKTSAFENKAFVADTENANSGNDRAFSTSKNRPPKSPSIKSRQSVNANNNSPKSKSRKDLLTRQKGQSIDSSREDEDRNNLTYSLGSEEEGGNDAEDARSDVTYTVVSEKNRPKEPAKPRKPKRLTKIPMPDEMSSSRPNSKAEDVKHKKRDIINAPVNRKNRGKDDHVAVDIEPEKKASNKGEEESKDNAEQDESETVSVSSTAPKESVKSRFGKLFNTSSSDATKSKKNVDEKVDKDNKDKEQQVDEGGSVVKEKSGFVKRWKQTLLKGSSSKANKESKTEDKEVGSSTTNDNQEELSELHEAQSKTMEKSGDSRIFIPEIGSDEDNESVKSFSSVSVEKETRPEKRRGRKTQISESEFEAGESRKDKESSEQRKSVEVEADIDSLNKKVSGSKFQPLAKIWRSKTKANKEKDLVEPPISSSKDFASEETKKEAATETAGMALGTVKSTKSVKKKKDAKAEEQKAKLDKEKARKRYVSETEEDPLSKSDEGSESKSEEELEGEESTETVKKKIKGPSKSDTIQLVDSNTGQDLLFGITVHQSDLLPLDPNVIHPVVKITVMYQNGKYMKRSEDGKGFPREIVGAKEGGGGSKSDKRRRKNKDEDDWFTENVSESVLPIMSQPCQTRHSIPTFVPTWNELLVFEEPFRRFAIPHENREAEKEPIIFFEVMDFLPMNNNGNWSSITGFHGSETGWYKIAWAFLRPIGASSIVNLNKKLRLQLYQPVKLRGKEKLPGPEVYSWWKAQRWEKLKSTLYVTPKGIIPPETRTASLRQLLSMRKEQLTQAILDSQLATKRKSSRTFRDSVNDLRDIISWSKMEGQSCKPPNKLVATLPKSQIESLNIIISGNVHAVKFSPCGRKLAAGLDTDELHVVLIFEVPSWALLKSLKGHHGIIYEITWKAYDFNDVTSYMYLASCSADSTVRIWKMDNHDGRSMTLAKVLYHPAYVYSVRFHPTHPSMVVTGCFDGIIRVWDFKPEHSEPLQKKSKKRVSKQDVAVSPIVLLDKHTSFVNCLLYDHSGQHLFSGDGAAFIFRWSCASPSQKKHWKLERDAKLHQGDVPINSIDLHPSGNRILVQLRDNFIKVLEVVTFIPLQTFSGLSNERFQIRSCFSPCGNLVLSGSEDSTLCIWDADTAKILQFVSPHNHPHCIVSAVDYHPFDYYIAVGVSSAISEPSPVLVYFYEQPARMNYPMLKKSAMKMKQSLEKSRSQSSESPANPNDGDLGTKPFPAKRGDSTEKFLNIIQKLDTALYMAQKRNQQRRAETESSTCAAAAVPVADEDQRGVPETEKEINLNNENPENVGGSSHFQKRSDNDRPRSASLASKKRDKFRKTREEERSIKSDSEQVASESKKAMSKSRHQSLDVEQENATVSIEQSEDGRAEPPRPKPLKRRSKTVDS